MLCVRWLWCFYIYGTYFILSCIVLNLRLKKRWSINLNYDVVWHFFKYGCWFWDLCHVLLDRKDNQTSVQVCSAKVKFQKNCILFIVDWKIIFFIHSFTTLSCSDHNTCTLQNHQRMFFCKVQIYFSRSNFRLSWLKYQNYSLTAAIAVSIVDTGVLVWELMNNLIYYWLIRWKCGLDHRTIYICFVMCLLVKINLFLAMHQEKPRWCVLFS